MTNDEMTPMTNDKMARLSTFAQCKYFVCEKPNQTGGIPNVFEA